MQAPDIRFATRPDGIRVAYAAFGDGYPVITVPGWVSHLEIDMEHPDVAALIDSYLARGLRLIRFDKSGTGLSDRRIDDHSPEARMGDIEAIAEDLGLERFALVAYSEGGPIAVTYAAVHPGRVSHLVLNATFARMPDHPRAREVQDALLGLVRAEWGMGSEAIGSMLVPDATPEVRAWFQRVQREGASRRQAADLLEAVYQADVRPLLDRIEAPTLVVHGQQDRAIPFECGRELAARIRGARLVPHAGGHIALNEARDAILDFLAPRSAPAPAPPEPKAPFRQGASVTVLFTDIERNTELLARLGDEAWRALLREHEVITRDALRQHGGAEIKTIGDAFMASFTSATRALECAIALQRAFSQRNDDAEHVLRVRVGVNAGEPIAEDGDLFGTSVTMASRIAGMAAGGEILASNVVRELVAGKGFLFADRGDSTLRGFEDPVRIYEVRWQAPRP